MLKRSGSGSSSRAIATCTVLPAGPRSILKTSSLLTVFGTGLPSISTIRSPARMPSRNEGVPSSGEITVMTPSRISNCTPIPEYSPWNCSSMRWARCSGR